MRLALRVLVIHNVPFAVWTAYAAYRAISSGGTGAGGWPCPVQVVFHWCPSCGLTGAYARLLSSPWTGGQVTGDQVTGDPMLFGVLALFLLNAGWSLRLARKASTTPVSPPPKPESAPAAQDPSAAC